MAQKFRNVSTGQVIEVDDKHVEHFDRMARWERTDETATKGTKTKRTTRARGKKSGGTESTGEADNKTPQNDDPADGGLTESPGEKPGGQKQANTVDKDVNNNVPPQTRRHKNAADNGTDKDNSTKDPQ